ncbi:hypothetical protein WMY93_010067 [Mugilogobius chulae]|uniref:Uncharacterized protein n=1 Tax=Mugilogobius chulae TaxID=88201 RepID=A0AAW0PIN1_9GOBI
MASAMSVSGKQVTGERIPSPVTSSLLVAFHDTQGIRFVQVKTEESLLQQRQTEIKEETQEEDVSTKQREETDGEDIKVETHFYLSSESESSETDNDDDWEPFSCSRSTGNHIKPVQTRTSQQNSSQNEAVSGTAAGADKNRFKLRSAVYLNILEQLEIPSVGFFLSE